jgi:UPF0716 protein FxsA
VLLPLVIIFVIVPIAELALIIQVGEAIGVWWTIALLVGDSVLGSMLMRSQGRAAWRRFNQATSAGRVPAREAIDGVLVIFGGALLLTPGFISDILGLLLLLPPTRAVARRVLVRRFAHRLVASATGARGRGPFAPPPQNGHGGYDVEGRAVELDTDRLDPPAR